MTAAFWVLTFFFAYGLLLYWWPALVYLAAGSVLTYCWWQRRRHGRFSIVFGSLCALSAVMTWAVSAWAFLIPISIPVDSLGHRRMNCGSVVSPVPAAELKVTAGGMSGPGRHPIPQSWMAETCADELFFRGSRAAGVALIGVFLAVRAYGHFSTPRSTQVEGAA
ncbi:hypothetical protein [Rhodococcus sp. SGAir0479]|uniref:hypothetical protein n=1 Tax=Rhodococcus sp. SGAir0479 TaxID=2567884 RepID=UPI0010CD4D00|nr:hypothetical protein [Rhodococcus sp. SGAir0479]QCQ91153.1 hypothetical protein E7742_07805 [Rhodococcus sp. SGAir0479]